MDTQAVTVHRREAVTAHRQVVLGVGAGVGGGPLGRPRDGRPVVVGGALPGPGGDAWQQPPTLSGAAVPGAALGVCRPR